jgi:hypothetical protein
MKKMLQFTATLVLLVTAAGCTSRTIAVPIGASARAGDFIATLVRSHDPAVVSLHPNPEDQRFTLSLLLVSNSERRVVTIASGLRQADAGSNTQRILGDDGQRLWFLWSETSAYDYKARKLLRRQELPRQIPKTLEDSFVRLSESLPAQDHFLSSTKDFGGAEHYKSALIHRYVAGNRGTTQTLRLTDPDSVLLTYWTQRGLKGTFVVSRIESTTGKALWTVNTGFADLDQILPDARQLAIRGKGPMVPDKLSEPFVMLIDTATGAQTMHSLWVKPQI